VSFAACFMANDRCWARPLHGIKKAPFHRASTIAQNSQDDSVRSLLFLNRV
jgi:hypothetical protein